MKRTAGKGVPMPMTILLFLTALGLFIASGFAVRRVPSLTDSEATILIRIDFVIPVVALWFAYWFILHLSAWLRPRTWWRELGFVVLSLGLVHLSWWIRVATLASRYRI
jgi:hypothetical protein